MTGFDPYEVLGIRFRKSITPETITKAFRQKSKLHHPDRGGDPVKFQEVKLAYEVLSDPDRRRRYDETGEYDDGPKLDEKQSKLVQCLNATFTHVCQQLIAQGISLVSENLVSWMARCVKQNLGIHKKAIREMEKARSQLEKLKGRFKTNALSANLLEGIVAQQLAEGIQGLERMKADQTVHEDCLKLLKDFTFDVSEMEDGFGVAYGSATNGSYRRVGFVVMPQ
jgi:hypothetical protein